MEIDVTHPLWRAVEAYAREKIETKQACIEGPLDQPSTDRHRGYIQALRELIREAYPDPRLVEAQRDSLNN